MPLYPIPTEKNKLLYEKYKSIETDVIFTGRLGAYRYYNMDAAIMNAMVLAEKLWMN